MMDFVAKWRCKELQEVVDESAAFLAVGADSAQFRETAAAILRAAAAPVPAAAAAYLSPTLISDVHLDDFAADLTQTAAGAETALAVFRAPTADPRQLRERQRVLRFHRDAPIPGIHFLKDAEPVLNWWATAMTGAQTAATATAPTSASAILFPESWPIRYINRIPPALLAFHIYRGYLAPYLGIIYPLTTVFAPYFYIRRTLSIRIPLRAYLKLVFTGVRAMLIPSGDFQHVIFRYILMAVYAGLFIYSTLQSFDLAALIRRLWTDLHAKTEVLRRVLDYRRTMQPVIASIRGAWGFEAAAASAAPAAAALPWGMAGTYELLKNRGGFWREVIDAALVDVGLLDLIEAAAGKLRSASSASASAWTFPKYLGAAATSATRILEMRHPGLPAAVANPFSFEKSLILTGPNAAGKTTYMKAAAANLLLAQTLGLCCGRGARIRPAQAFGSFVRVGDTLGYESLFQAEVQRCASLCRIAERAAAAGGHAVFFLDEPMHSTPPIEGAATAAAVLQYLGALPGVRVLLTTHYHELIGLETDPELGGIFRNISMTATPVVSGPATPVVSGPDSLSGRGPATAFAMSYRIRGGPCRDCIALELLQENGLSDAVIKSAIKIKNKICCRVLEVPKC